MKPHPMVTSCPIMPRWTCVMLCSLQWELCRVTSRASCSSRVSVLGCRWQDAVAECEKTGTRRHVQFMTEGNLSGAFLEALGGVWGKGLRWCGRGWGHACSCSAANQRWPRCLPEGHAGMHAGVPPVCRPWPELATCMACPTCPPAKGPRRIRTTDLT